jgi:predicted Zn-dependent peptidase
VLQIDYKVDPSLLEQSLGAVRHSISLLKHGEFSSRLVDYFKNSSIPQTLYNIGAQGMAAAMIGEQYLNSRYGGKDTYFDSLKIVPTLTADDAVEVANRYLNNPRLFVLMPKQTHPQTDVPNDGGN